MLTRIWSNRNSSTLPMGMQMVEPLSKTVWQFHKTKILFPYNPAIMFLDIYPKELKSYVHTKTFTWMFIGALIHNCQISEASKMSF